MSFTSSLDHEDDSPLSTLSPTTSFDNIEAQDSNLKFIWRDGPSTADGQEFGQEVTMVNEASAGQKLQEDVSKYDATPKSGGTGTRYDATYLMSELDSIVASTPKAGTKPKADTGDRYSYVPNRYNNATPKAGTAARRSDRINLSLDQDASEDFYDQNELTTPSWDIDRVFSFRDKKEPPQPRQETIPTSFSGIWDVVSAIGSWATHHSGGEEDKATNHTGEGETIQGDSSNEVDGPQNLREAQENDLFAMEVGLM